MSGARSRKEYKIDKLISANAVITILENARFRAGKDLSKTYLIADLQEQIERLSAAFDKEEVKAKLQAKAEHASDKRAEAGLYDVSVYWVGREEGFKEAIKIVEKGGVE